MAALIFPAAIEGGGTTLDEDTQEPVQTMDLYLIHDGTLALERLHDLVSHGRLIETTRDRLDSIPAQARVLLFLNEDDIRDLMPMAVDRQWEVGFLVHPEATKATRTWGVSGDVEDLIRHYQRVEAIDADVLCCNDQVVLSSVTIGEVLGLKPYDAARPPTHRDTFLAALRAMKDLRLARYKVTTGKDQQVQLAALGMLVLEQTQSNLVGRCFSEPLDIADGRLAMLVFTPRSVLAYAWFLLRLMFRGQISLSRLPPSLGMISSNRVVVDSSRGTDYLLDGKPISAKNIEFRILEKRMRLLPGPGLVLKEEEKQNKGSGKDTVRLQNVPLDEAARHLFDAPLPVFNHASEIEHRELFVALRENAKASSSYLVLMVLSVLLALSGLYANSAPVIIGAMILAPLMAPIISLSMGLARTDVILIQNSARTLAAGIGLGLFFAITVAWVMPLDQITPEMRGRMFPTLLDLSVAVISGIAGAYAHSKKEIAKSLAGVAIAVALVPPLSVAGIAVGWADWSMARGAFLLFVTNLVGISLAASTTFLVLGFAPLKLARRGLMISLGLLAVISIPLYLAFVDLVEQEQIMKTISSGQVQLADRVVRVRVVKVRNGEPPLVRVVLSSPQRLDEAHVDELKQLFIHQVGRPVLLEAQMNLRR